MFLLKSSKLMGKAVAPSPMMVRPMNFKRFQATATTQQTSGSQDPNKIPDGVEGSTGYERSEQVEHFYDREVVKGPLKGGFGTMDAPVLVPSYNENRLVGCTGSAEEEHDVLWHEVAADKPTVCLECGQVFELTKLKDDSHAGHHHH